ncbi:hypothetical protein AQUCO_07200103v1 [Aquilegia coerulea]|uniref:Uncharacterized protein n=1 Tax=Aquilegia coerulea TaxID=218851 RepID=A0A2G5CAB6_AQUCA|nr:hypothetical protein AQUCO_07200103v1 [Aquilegia coerulea]
MPSSSLPMDVSCSDKKKASSSSTKSFPPPISNPVTLKSYRQNGRLIIKIVNDPVGEEAKEVDQVSKEQA